MGQRRVNWYEPLEELTRTTGKGATSTLCSFLTLSMCALSAGRYEALYLEEVKQWNDAQHLLMTETLANLIGAMETAPYTDLLGEVYTEWSWNKDKQRTGEYYTPQHICDLMAQITMGAPPKERPITMCKPACGSGRMILAGAKCLSQQGVNPNEMWVQATDLSKYACYMTFINTTFWGIPAQVIHGNSLSLETFATFENTFWYPLAQDKLEPDNKTLKQPSIKLGGESVQVSLFEDAA